MRKLIGERQFSDHPSRPDADRVHFGDEWTLYSDQRSGGNRYGFYSLSFLKSTPLIVQAESTMPFLVYLVGILMASVGIGLMLLLLEIYHKYGRKKLMAAFYMIGFNWYIIIFIIKLIIPGDDAEDNSDDVRDTYSDTTNHLQREVSTNPFP